MPDAAIEEAAALVATAEHIVVLTGAGISTDSGIRDFRGPDGVWTRNPEAEKLANIEYYLADPEIRRKAWRTRTEHPAWNAQPNTGHRALVDLEATGRLDLLITQNVDGLHLAAGTSRDLLVEIHGTIRETECLTCGDRLPMAEVLERVAAGEEDPPCRICGGIVKSATVSFGQSLVAADLRRSDVAARHCDLLLAVGTTLGVYPIANVVPLAKAHGARVVIVNGSATEMDELADVLVRGSISEVLPSIVGSPE